MIELKGNTNFRSPLENEMYEELIGARKTQLESEGRPVYQYRDLLLSTNREYSGIYCEASIFGKEKFEYMGNTYIIDKNLDDVILTTDEEKKLFSTHFYGNLIFTLEGLVYVFAKLYHKKNCENYYNETLKSLKTQALQRTFNNLDTSIFKNLKNYEQLNPIIDAFMRVMTMSSEESNRFSDVFIFNTTGIYEKEDANNRIKFLFYTPDDKKHYEIHSYGNDSWSLHSRVDDDNYVELKIHNGKIYIVRMKEADYRIWDLTGNKTSTGLFTDSPDYPWTNTTPEELQELADAILKMNDNVSLINSAFEDVKTSRK